MDDGGSHVSYRPSSAVGKEEGHRFAQVRALGQADQVVGQPIGEGLQGIGVPSFPFLPSFPGLLNSSLSSYQSPIIWRTQAAME